MKNGKKTGRLTILLGALGLMCMLTGCTKTSEKADGREEDIIRIEASMDESTRQNDGSQQEQKDEHEKNAKMEEEQEADSEAMAQIPDESDQAQAELEGDVRSIGEDSMVVSKIFTYTEDGEDIAVSYAEESPDAILITIYFSENAEFIVRTVKNGGVNGDADVENRAGTFSDIQEGKTVRMTGGYEGEDFRAEQVIIYQFI